MKAEGTHVGFLRIGHVIDVADVGIERGEKAEIAEYDGEHDDGPDEPSLVFQSDFADSGEELKG